MNPSWWIPSISSGNSCCHFDVILIHHYRIFHPTFMVYNCHDWLLNYILLLIFLLRFNFWLCPYANFIYEFIKWNSLWKYYSPLPPQCPMLLFIDHICFHNVYPDSKDNGANMGSIWGRQDPGGPHVGPMNFAIWVAKHVFVIGLDMNEHQCHESWIATPLINVENSKWRSLKYCCCCCCCCCCLRIRCMSGHKELNR